MTNLIEPDADFGRYLASVAERDVDLLLMEEFHVSDAFVGWFCDQVGLKGVKPAGAWHSLSDTDNLDGPPLKPKQNGGPGRAGLTPFSCYSGILKRKTG